MSNVVDDSNTFGMSSSAVLVAVAAVCVSAVVAFFVRRRNISCLPTQPNQLHGVSATPPPVRAAASAAMKAMSAKDIIRKIVTPPSPDSPAAASPRMRRQTLARSPLSASAPRASSPKSGSKSANRKAGNLGVFQADFIVAEKKERDGVYYRVRSAPASRFVCNLRGGVTIYTTCDLI